MYSEIIRFGVSRDVTVLESVFVVASFVRFPFLSSFVILLYIL